MLRNDERELINKQTNKLMLKVWKQPWEVNPYYSKIRLARDNKPRWLETYLSSHILKVFKERIP